MQDALISGLSRVRSPRVTSNTSAMRYAGTTEPLPSIADAKAVPGRRRPGAGKARRRPRRRRTETEKSPLTGVWFCPHYRGDGPRFPSAIAARQAIKARGLSQ